MRSLVSSQSAKVALQCTSKKSVKAGTLVRSYYTVATRPHQVASKCTLKKQTHYIPPAPLSPPSYSSFLSNVYPREIIFLGGAPGSGKGTNSSHISHLRNYSAPTIVVSDLLNTPACKLLKDNGIMVNDEFVFQALLTELRKPIYSNCIALSNREISRQQARGLQQLAANGEVRHTDSNPKAAKARYDVFKTQLSAVMGLGKQFPLVVVDASAEPQQVKDNIARQMAVLPSVLL